MVKIMNNNLKYRKGFPNIYTLIIDAPIWSSNIPESIEIRRSYYTNLNPVLDI